MIFDFTPLESGEKNYNILEPENWEVVKSELEGVEGEVTECFPVPVRYGGTIPDDAFFG